MKKLLTIILAASIAAALMPGTAYADERDSDSAVNVKSSADAVFFVDVSPSAWYAPAVEYVVSNGIMNGVGNNCFHSESNLTRGMLVQMLYNLEGRPSGAHESGFADVAPDSWYRDAVDWADANGIVSGFGNNMFGPENVLTREQMAAIMQRYSKYKDYKVSVSGDVDDYTIGDVFDDSDQVSDWAYYNILWALGEGIIKGSGNGRIDAQGTATRAQAAQIFKNFNDTVVKDNKDNGSGSEWDAVNYTIRREDLSRQHLEYYYDYVQITDEDYPYAGQINKILSEDKDIFLNEYSADFDFDEYANDAAERGTTYFNRMRIHGIYCKNGVLSIMEATDWYMGGVYNRMYTSFTFDLKTGRQLTLSDLLDMDDQRAADTARNAVYSGIDPESRGLLYGPEDDQIKNYDAGDFKYYVDPSGKVKLLFDSYELGAGALGSPVIDTGFSISAYLNR